MPLSDEVRTQLNLLAEGTSGHVMIRRYDLEALLSAYDELKTVYESVLQNGPLTQDEQGGCVYCGNDAQYNDTRPHRHDCTWKMAVLLDPDHAQEVHSANYGTKLKV